MRDLVMGTHGMVMALREHRAFAETHVGWINKLREHKRMVLQRHRMLLFDRDGDCLA